MDNDVITRFWTDLVGRLTGPMSFRMIMQPIMASLFALRDGMKDARGGRPAYLWTVVSDPAERRYLLSDGWKAVGKVFILAVVLDVLYQLMVFRWVYPLELLSVALALAVVPYAVLRGPVNRLARLFLRN